ncbi:MAG: hypothetical protein HY718_10755 [Planctomycetes bacterium]|nr:hypothetical protein [Planctomycetota bacterium]
MRQSRHTLVFVWEVLVSLGLASVSLAIEHGRPGGQPYELAGRRIVFSTWYYVRPGQPDWQDDAGVSRYAKRLAYPADALHYTYEDRPHGVRLRAEAAQRTGPVIAPERPWEQRGISVSTLLLDEGRYRLWAASRDKNLKWRGVYYESADGRNWQRPNLGQVEFEGSRDNNLLAFNAESVFKDPAGPAAERYKCVWHGDYDPKRFEEFKKTRPYSTIALEMDPGRVHAILGAVSPDGLSWTQLPDALSVEPSDTHIVGYYDLRLAKYVLYTRSYMVGPRAPGFPPPSPAIYQFLARRAIGRTESADFRAFAPAETIIEPGPDSAPTDQYYSNCRTTVPDGPDQHLLFPAVFHLDTDNTSIELHASYDGKLWHRVPGSPVLDTAAWGQWDGGCIFTSPELTELPDGSWVLPYTGFKNTHKYPSGLDACGFGLAVWPKGRLVAIEAPGDGGFTTEGLVPPGGRLRINAVTARTGSILIEAADLEGKPIPGRGFAEAVPIVGDQVWAPVKWKTVDDLGIKSGEPVVLRFRMNHARIYGLQFDQ